jgi:hypothetical protein
VTSRETLGISPGLHANMSLLHRRKSTSSLSYLGFKLALIWMVLAGSSASISTALASSAALKVSDEGGMAGPSDAKVALRLSSLNSTVATATEPSSRLSCS